MGLIDEAKSYARRGWSIIPIDPSTKQALVKWGQYQVKRPSEAELVDWWSRWPSACLAVVTGSISGIAVVDVDPRHGGSESSIPGRTGLRSKTANGGSHLFFKAPAEPIPSKAAIYPGVDLRAEGGYAILPPSTTTSGAYVWTDEGEPSALPPDIKDQSLSRKVRDDHWISNALAGVVEGERNDLTAAIAGYFAAKGFPADLTEQILILWDRDRNNPPLEGHEIKQTVESIYRTAAKKQAKTSSPVFGLTSLRDFMLTHGGTRPTWTIKEWLPQQTVAFVVAPPGHFKTWVLLDLAISVAGGFPFLGHYPVLEPGPVIIMQQEDFFGQIADRIGTILKSKMGTEDDPAEGDFQAFVPPDLPIFIHEDRSFRFDDQVVLDALHERIRTIRPALVILDPLYSAVSTQNYMADAVVKMMAFKEWRDKYGTSFLIAHHTKKSAGKGEADREEAWGAQFLNAFLETGWQIRGLENEDTKVMLHRHFKVTSGVSQATVGFDISTEPPYSYRVDVEAGRVAASSEEIISALTRLGVTTAARLGEALGLSQRQAMAALRNLEAEGKVVRRGGKWEAVAGDAPGF